jgi:thioesterase domain-containing protein
VPFVLVGWSFGGVIAFAMAEQLEERMPAERVVLLDSIAPVDEFKRPDALAVDLVLGWFAMYLAAKRGTRLPLASGAAASLPLGDALALILQAATAARALPVWTTLPGLRKVYDTYVDGLRRNNELARAFVPHPAALPLTLIKPAGSLLPGSRTLGWDTLAGTALDVRVCSGDHYTMLGEPTAIAAVAAIVRGHLMRPRRERAVPSPDAATVYSNRSTL